MILEGVVEAKALPPGTSAQRAELIALMRALKLLRGKSECVYQLKVSFPNFACTWFHLGRKRTVNLQIKRRLSMQQKFKNY